MKLNEGIKHILNGDALLFCGSGFSVGAMSILDKPLLTGGRLIEKFSNELNIDDNDLDYLSQKYQKEHGNDKLIKLLKDNFTVKSVEDYHKIICDLPWKRVYTTNYDNVIETAGKKFNRNSVTLKDFPDKIKNHKELVIHLNGSISKSSFDSDSLEGEIKLTKTSYLSRIFTESKWYSIFLNDLKSVKAIFFIGFSLDFDLEIQQVISFANQKEKIFFVNGPKLNTKAQDILSDHGNIIPMYGADFSSKIQEVAKDYIPVELETHLNIVKPISLNNEFQELKDNNITDLLFFGDFKDNLYFNHPDSYTFKRDAMESVINSINNGKKIIIVHSELGNGKTIFLEILKCKLSLEKKYHLFLIDEISGYIYNDLTSIIEKSSDKKKAIFFIDNYNNYLKILNMLNNLNVQNIILILTARSYIHEISFSELLSLDYVNYNNIAEFSLDTLSSKEINSIINYFNKHNYLWGENSNKSKSGKTNWLKNKCRSNLKSIIVSTYEKSTTKEKLYKLK